MARSANVSRPGRSLAVLVGLLAVLYGTIAAGSGIRPTPSGRRSSRSTSRAAPQIILTPVPQPGQSGNVPRRPSPRPSTSSGSGSTGPGSPRPRSPPRARTTSSSRSRAGPTGDHRAGGERGPDAVPRRCWRQPLAGPRPPRPRRPPVRAARRARRRAPPHPRRRAPRAAPSATASSNGRAIPPAAVDRAPRAAAATTPKPAATATPLAAASTPAASGSLAATPTPSPPTPATRPGSPRRSSSSSIALDCTDPKNRTGGNGRGDPAKPFVTCSQDGTEKYILGPAEVVGTDIKTRVGQPRRRTSQGNATGGWEVQLSFTGNGTKKFADVTTRLAAIPQTDARNQFAIVLDGLVISAPSTNERDPGRPGPDHRELHARTRRRRWPTS